MYPGGWAYASYRPAQLSIAQGGTGVFNGAANGGADFVYDLTTTVSNLDGGHAIDGLWAADGTTAYGATPDGQHMSYLNHIYAANDLNTNYVASTVLGF